MDGYQVYYWNLALEEFGNIKYFWLRGNKNAAEKAETISWYALLVCEADK